jgi:hypothetical protein
LGNTLFAYITLFSLPGPAAACSRGIKFIEGGNILTYKYDMYRYVISDVKDDLQIINRPELVFINVLTQGKRLVQN